MSSAVYLIAHHGNARYCRFTSEEAYKTDSFVGRDVTIVFNQDARRAVVSSVVAADDCLVGNNRKFRFELIETDCRTGYDCMKRYGTWL